MSKLDKANKARIAHGLGEVSVGFDIPATIQKICRDGRYKKTLKNGREVERRYKIPNIAACIGVSAAYVRALLEGRKEPGYITAQFLVGLWKDVFKDYKLESLPMSAAQKRGGTVAK